MPLVRRSTAEERLRRQGSAAERLRASSFEKLTLEEEQAVRKIPERSQTGSNGSGKKDPSPPTMASPRTSPHQSPDHRQRSPLPTPPRHGSASPQPRGPPLLAPSPGRHPSISPGDILTYGPPQSHHPRPPSVPGPIPNPGSGQSSALPPLVIPLPAFESLMSTLPSLPTLPNSTKLAFITSTIRHLDRHLKHHSLPSCPSHFIPLISTIIPILLSFTAHPDPAIRGPSCYLKAHLLSTGSCPRELPKDPRQAFKDFETAARAGERRAWFRLGRDYEACGEEARAKGCFERGVGKGDGECIYRMGMAHLMGQLGVPASPLLALPLLRHAARLATLDAPQSAYVLGMLLAGEFESVVIPPTLLLPPNSPPSPALLAQHAEARNHILHSAYLCFSPAQYKAGYMHEHATLGAAYDPLLSVQYYSLASQNGEVEADMALSKWFLVGAEGAFEKNEGLARTFATKAARAGLGSGCFALGYYYELGIGGRIDPDQARAWYHKAAEKGNKDAIGRLQALAKGPGSAISVQQHEATLNNTLLRSRTLARERSNQGQYAGRRSSEVELRARAEAERQAQRASQMFAPRGGYGSPSISPQQGPQATDRHERLLSADDMSLPPPAQSAGFPHSSSMPSMDRSPRLAAPNPNRTQSPVPMPRRGGINNGESRPHAESTHRQRESFSLHDPGAIAPTDDWQAGPEREPKPPRTPRPPPQPVAQTFAEMGFVSKASKEDDCIVM